MSWRNPAREFLRRVKALQDRAEEVTNKPFGGDAMEDGVKIWPFSYNRECHRNKCKKRKDGLWEQSKLHHTGNDSYKMVFIWRLHPNYCCVGQPIYNTKQQEQFLAKSETEKILLTDGIVEFVWLWEDIRMPTETVWGMGMGPTFYEIRVQGFPHYRIRSYSKIQLLRDYKQYSKFYKSISAKYEKK